MIFGERVSSTEARTACAASNPVVDVVDVAAFIALCRLDLSTEASIQRGLETLLRAEYGARVRREVRLSARDRVDFMIDSDPLRGVAIEVKHRRAKAAPTLAQLARYAEHPAVEAIILATGWPMPMPAALNGKPVRVVGLGSAWL